MLFSVKTHKRKSISHRFIICQVFSYRLLSNEKHSVNGFHCYMPFRLHLWRFIISKHFLLVYFCLSVLPISFSRSYFEYCHLDWFMFLLFFFNFWIAHVHQSWHETFIMFFALKAHWPGALRSASLCLCKTFYNQLFSFSLIYFSLKRNEANLMKTVNDLFWFGK